jgi:membrane-bound lytic murein transglycosylase D
LEPAIAFWQHTYAVWGRSQVAIHDDRHMGVVYEVVDLPGEVGDSMTPEQRQWVAERREYWRSRLLALEDRISAGGRLDGGDQQLASILESGGGVRAVLPGASERVRSQRGMRERFMRGLQIGARYESTYRKIFRDAGLPEDLAYLPHVESSFQFAAHSSAGAVGVWQFTRAGAQNYLTVNSRVDERLDPIASTYGAARYLGDAYAKLGDWPTTLTSYNHGVNGMVRAQGQMGNDFIRIVKHYNSPAFGFAGRNYYAEFLAARDIARNPQQYFAQAGDYGLSD